MINEKLNKDIFDLINENKTEINNIKGKILPTLLYSDKTGTDTDFTLTDDISNYSFIEVFGYNSFTGNRVSSGKIKSNHSKVQVLLRDNYVQTGKGVSQAFCFKVLKFEGKNVNRIQYNTWWTDSGSVESDNIFVTEVIGFKY